MLYMFKQVVQKEGTCLRNMAITLRIKNPNNPRSNITLRCL